MKKTLLLAILCCTGITLSAQTVFKKRSFVDIGGGSALFLVTNNIEGNDASNDGDAGGITADFAISYHYALADQFTMGLEASSGTMLLTDSNGVGYFQHGDFSIISNYYLKNGIKKGKKKGKPGGKACWYIGARLGASTMEIERKENDGDQGLIKGNTITFGLQTGGRIFINKWLGGYCRFHYTHRPFVLTDYSVNGTAVETLSNKPVDQIFLNFDHYGFDLGLSFRFGGMKNSEPKRVSTDF